ncbi:MAG: hypothetical protein K5871_09165 [Lachnospiraceae bacterium]|nr:hypothetical protein [Lachnospiraceae bacterium]
MKKRLLAVLIAGLMTGTMAACGGTGTSAEEPHASAVQADDDDEPAAEPAAEPAVTGTEDVTVDAGADVTDIPQGVWIYGQSHNSWVVIDGDTWQCLNENGDAISEGNVISGDGVLELYDDSDTAFFTFSVEEDGALFDEMYMVEYFPVDHLPEKFPAQLEAEIGFDAIVGDWTYQEQDTDDYETYIDMAFVRIFEDGRYTIRYNGEEDDHLGIILIELDVNPDGTTIPMYSFFEGGNNYWNGCYMGYGEGEPIYFGNGGTARLIPAEGVG